MKKLIAFALLASATLSIHAQGTINDYKRAFSTGTRHSWKMTNGSINVHRSFNGPKDQFIYSTYNSLLESGWRMDEIDCMDMPGFLKMRAWNAKQEQKKKEPRQRYIDEVWSGLKP